jgi:hypothetical protein
MRETERASEREREREREREGEGDNGVRSSESRSHIVQEDYLGLCPTERKQDHVASVCKTPGCRFNSNSNSILSRSREIAIGTAASAFPQPRVTTNVRLRAKLEEPDEGKNREEKAGRSPVRDEMRENLVDSPFADD